MLVLDTHPKKYVFAKEQVSVISHDFLDNLVVVRDDDVFDPRASVSETARLCVAALISPSQSRHPCRLYELGRGTATATADDG